MIFPVAVPVPVSGKKELPLPPLAPTQSPTTLFSSFLTHSLPVLLFIYKEFIGNKERFVTRASPPAGSPSPAITLPLVCTNPEAIILRKF
jgi:hypothetical protein